MERPRHGRGEAGVGRRLGTGRVHGARERVLVQRVMCETDEVVEIAYRACDLLDNPPDGVVTVEMNGETLHKDVHFFAARDAVEVLSCAEALLGEDRLDDALHAKVTDLLCELVALDIMQVLHTAQEARTTTTWRP